MRMRHKKNLETRLQAVQDCLIKPGRDAWDFRVQEEKRIDLGAYFQNDNPVFLEVGCGKGGFGCTFAAQHPEYNILCVEKTPNVIVIGCESAKKQGLKNILFLNTAAEYLTSYLAPNSVQGIFLNFSCPFPKNRQVAHRLTHPRFLEIYKTLLKDGGIICQKTDNMHFFEYSLESFSQNGFILQNISLNLHQNPPEDNIMTEYEKKFVGMGLPIYRLEAYVK